MKEIRWTVATVVGAAAASVLTGCGAGSWCSPSEPGPSVTAEYAPTAERLRALPGVTEVTARYWQPDDSHCVSREYLETAAWSADFTVHVRTGFTLAQIGSVRAALGASTATVTAAAGDDLAGWEVELANPSGATPAPTAAPLIVDERGYRLVTGAAALPDVTIAQQDVRTTIRVRTPASLPGAATWLRGHLDRNDSSSVYVGTATTWTASVSVTGVTAASDTSIATAAALTAAHPDLTELSVSGSGVTGVVPTERQAREVVAAFEETPADSAGQRVSVWWTDGNGSQVSGRFGARR